MDEHPEGYGCGSLTFFPNRVNYSIRVPTVQASLPAVSTSCIYIIEGSKGTEEGECPSVIFFLKKTWLFSLLAN